MIVFHSPFSELTDHLSNILEHQKIETVKTKEVSEEEKARKAAILAAYSAVDSGDEYPLFQNLNTLSLNIWAASWQNQQNGMWAQRRLKDQSLCCALNG